MSDGEDSQITNLQKIDCEMFTESSYLGLKMIFSLEFGEHHGDGAQNRVRRYLSTTLLLSSSLA